MKHSFIRTALGCLPVIAVTACGGAGDASDEGALESGVQGVALEPSDQAITPEMNPAEESPLSGDTTKACANRADLTDFITPRAGSWGDWAPCYTFCPANAFAYEARLKSESNQGGGGDDTAANGVGFHCFDRTTGTDKGWITSSTQQWGSWGTIVHPQAFFTNNPWFGLQAWWERPQGSGDDTQLNKVGMYSVGGGQAGSPLFPSFAVDFSTDVNSGFCPSGTAICGIRTRVEATQVGDDTALNGVSFACCTF
jgi:hypothetical protein